MMLYDFGHLDMVRRVLKAQGETMEFFKSKSHQHQILVTDGIKTALFGIGDLCRNDYPYNFIKAAKKALKEEYRKGALNGVKSDHHK